MGIENFNCIGFMQVLSPFYKNKLILVCVPSWLIEANVEIKCTLEISLQFLLTFTKSFLLDVKNIVKDIYAYFQSIINQSFYSVSLSN